MHQRPGWEPGRPSGPSALPDGPASLPLPLREGYLLFLSGLKPWKTQIWTFALSLQAPQAFGVVAEQGEGSLGP